MTTASARRAVTPVRVRAIEDGRLVERPDRLVTEEPMEIRLQDRRELAEPVAVTMRTPGHDFELAVGLCRTEGLLQDADDLAEVRYCVDLETDQEYNVVTVTSRRPVDLTAHRRQVDADQLPVVLHHPAVDQHGVHVSALGLEGDVAVGVEQRERHR